MALTLALLFLAERLHADIRPIQEILRLDNTSGGKVDYIIRAKEAGFFIRLFFVSTESPTINAKRVANRVLNSGHDVPIPKIISRYDKSIANCIAIAPYIDRLYAYDNSIEDAEAFVPTERRRTRQTLHRSPPGLGHDYIPKID